MKADANGLYHINDTEMRPSRYALIDDSPDMINRWHETRCYQECIIHSKPKKKRVKEPYVKTENPKPKGGRKNIK